MDKFEKWLVYKLNEAEVWWEEARKNYTPYGSKYNPAINQGWVGALTTVLRKYRQHIADADDTIEDIE